MTTRSPIARSGLALATTLMLGLAAPNLAQAAIFNFPSNEPVRSEAAPERVQLAQSADTAQLLVRIQQLEEQLRSVNGQVEGLTFQLTQIQELITRTNEENRLRFEALGGGTSGAANQPAAATSAPATSTEVPNTEIPPQGVQPLPGEAEFDPTFDDGTAPMDDVGNSGDPLVGTNAAGGVDLTTGQPIDLNFTPGTETGNPDADAQFAAGAAALSSGDYAFAEDQFQQFLELYPDNARSQEAASLLGDALIQRGAFNEAADVLLKGYQANTATPQAPELLLKLGVSMAGVGERDVACRTFAQVQTNYPELTTAVAARLAAEKSSAQCPPA